jgi:hypothetical protein
MELREVLGDSIPAFTERFGRGENQYYQWQKGAQLPPPRVLEKTAKAEKWPRAIFEEGGPRPKDAVNGLVNELLGRKGGGVAEPGLSAAYRPRALAGEGRHLALLGWIRQAQIALNQVARLVEDDATIAGFARDAADAVAAAAAVDATRAALGEPADPVLPVEKPPRAG